MGDVEVVPPEGLTPVEFVKFALKDAQRYGGVVFRKDVAGRTIVLRISRGACGYIASVHMRQSGAWDPEPGGRLDDITVKAGCELYAWLDSREACDTMQKALVSPTGQALALCALFRLLDARNTLNNGMREAEHAQKEIAQ